MLRNIRHIHPNTSNQNHFTNTMIACFHADISMHQTSNIHRQVFKNTRKTMNSTIVHVLRWKIHAPNSKHNIHNFPCTKTKTQDETQSLHVACFAKRTQTTITHQHPSNIFHNNIQKQPCYDVVLLFCKSHAPTAQTLTSEGTIANSCELPRYLYLLCISLEGCIGSKSIGLIHRRV